MAKIIIEIEDREDGKVTVTSNPNFETMMAMDTSGHSLTAGHGYALMMLNTVWRESKKVTSSVLHLPRLGR